ncbi:hypothetical protein TBLA_0E00920 [Henningerozyma blattae CBS 6284]|uniref:PX domain-containing protein n=1 Tax=Henningerozyma blattae (strain ATCC 34711 / CBS 6284 / DSM 70876 / NBRC 10599 / NRRL Y-10934 / UCD 77-7) TaxID=1071380 RepID=I2H451_HENB6|nr:hypothetical protein TBLA_0E00920 [Tetrapisispora blattae CBS 6284]CCH61153.1 hypothetical protein TBLA_0E00920 [Tetrapisispora blattae CBS 6284]
MNFDGEDALAAPVWDDLAPTNDKPLEDITRISNSVDQTTDINIFNDDNAINKEIDDISSNQRLNHQEELRDFENPFETSALLHNTSPIFDNQTFTNKESNNGNTMESENSILNQAEISDHLTSQTQNDSLLVGSSLLDSLAPETDLVTSLNQDSTNIFNPQSSDEPLFASTFKSPLNLSEENEEETTHQQNNIITSNINSKQIQLLFKAPRIRRRPLKRVANTTSIDTTATSQPIESAYATVKTQESINSTTVSSTDKTTDTMTNISDPLSKFVTEKQKILQGSQTNSAQDSITKDFKNDIVEQATKPLFDLTLESPELKKSHENSNDGTEHSTDAIFSKASDKFQKESSADPTSDTRIDSDTPLHPDELENVVPVLLEEEPAMPLMKFEIEVIDPVTVGEMTSAHVEYTVISKCDGLTPNYSQVNRRYSDFRWLYRQLQNNNWGKIIPPPPEKQMIGKFKQDFIENRRLQMQNMLIRISCDPILQNDNDFQLFLQSSNFTFDAKTREFYSGSNASNDSNDLSEIQISEIKLLGQEDANIVMKSGGLAGDQRKGFMSMSLSFSSYPKYQEPDEFFITQVENCELIEEQLSNLYRALESVDTQRNDMSNLVLEFAASIDALSNLEPTKKTAELLTEFAKVHKAIKETLDRKSLQEALTLGSTLDEYIRSVASVKAIFNQRARLGYYKVIVENDYNKNKTQLEKFGPSNGKNANNEKRKRAESDFNAISIRFKKVNDAWTSVGETIKKELSHFETEKIQEFRNSMEIFLESSIESQKETIELWMTFYQNYL